MLLSSRQGKKVGVIVLGFRSQQWMLKCRWMGRTALSATSVLTSNKANLGRGEDKKNKVPSFEQESQTTKCTSKQLKTDLQSTEQTVVCSDEFDCKPTE